ncbi:UNVERIFIED_CONTAM: hypothetical protein Sradi_1320000 [Sesamum radiatum]|uniref:Uncharacterized protein n=1 Tax=Sesamum radiatum TaxID=300843 RepID=A0AAW2UNZ4_SESRA
MFRKLLRSQAGGNRGGGTPSRSPKGTPPLSESKGKRPASPSTGIRLEGSSKKSRVGSFRTPFSSAVKLPSGSPPLLL